MRSILLYLLLFYIKSASSKCLNSNTLSFTRELIPHTTDKRSLISYKNKTNISNNNTYLVNEDSENTLSVGNIQTLGDTQNESKQLSGNLINKSKQGYSLMVLPSRKHFRLKQFAEETCKVIKLVLVPSKFSGNYLSVLFGTTALGGLLSALLVSAASSDRVLKSLRSNWAFQGEMTFGSVEDYTKLGLAVFGFDLLFRTVFLRANLIDNLVNSNFFENVNWLGKSLGKVDKGLFNTALVGFANTVVLTRIVFLTYLHYQLMRNNWDTAHFLVAGNQSRPLSTFTFVSFFVLLFGHVVGSSLFGSFNTLMNTEHLLDPMNFRSNNLKRQVIETLTSLYRNMPSAVQKLVRDKHKYLMDLYQMAKTCSLSHGTQLEWSILCLHSTMALSSNSAAGLYLVLLQLAGLLLTGTMDWIEKVIIAENFDV